MNIADEAPAFHGESLKMDPGAPGRLSAGVTGSRSENGEQNDEPEEKQIFCGNLEARG
jgi:hypothetical protein